VVRGAAVQLRSAVIDAGGRGRRRRRRHEEAISAKSKEKDFQVVRQKR
jgi:hypothetical protein